LSSPPSSEEDETDALEDAEEGESPEGVGEPDGEAVT
jgi:hypothetical protein